MAQLNDIDPQQFAAAAKEFQKMVDAPKAGLIKKGNNVNSEIMTFRVLNLSLKESTISVQKFPKIENVNQALYLVSDADEELLIMVEFRQEIDLQSVTFHALQSPKEEEYGAPKDIALYRVDSLNKDFDDIEYLKGGAKLVGKKEKLSKGQKCSLKTKAIFRGVNKLIIYISSNINGTEQTYLNKIDFKGLVKGM